MTIIAAARTFSSFFSLPALKNRKVCRNALKILKDLDAWERSSPDDRVRLYRASAHKYGELSCQAHTAPYGLTNFFLSKLRLAPSIHETEQLLLKTRHRLRGCEYRWNIVPKTAKDNLDSALLEQLKGEALKWKGKQKLYTPEQKACLSAHDINQLKKIARYESYAKELLSSREELNNLFKFTLRDLYSVSCYFQFPEATKTLYRAHLTSQVGAFHGVKLIKRIRNAQGETESLGLKFDYLNRYVDILREDSVMVEENTTVRIQSIFDDFSTQNLRQGEYHVFRNGIRKWRMNESWKKFFGPEAPHNWYEKLPVEDIIPFTELKKRHPEVEEGQAYVGFETTRESINRDIKNTHGYLMLYKPQGDGTYRSWSFGVYAENWPNTKLGLFLMIGDTVPATWCSPDPNCRFPQRQKAIHPKFFSTDQEERSFEERFNHALRNKELIFQWGGENCAYQAEQLVTEEAPNLIRTRIDSVKTPIYLWPWVKPYHLTPKPLRWYVLQPILFSLLGWRTLYGKSLMKSEFSKKAEFHLPATLHEKIEKGLPGYIWGGHNREHEEVKS